MGDEAGSSHGDRVHLWGPFQMAMKMACKWGYQLPSLKLTAKAPENRPFQKDSDIPTINFQVRAVSFREGTY